MEGSINGNQLPVNYHSFTCSSEESILGFQYIWRLSGRMRNLCQPWVLFWTVALQSQLIPFVLCRVGNSGIFSNRLNEPPQPRIPLTLVGMSDPNKVDVPGKPLDPNDFLRAESIRVISEPPIGDEDPIMSAGRFQGDIILPDNQIVDDLNAHVASDRPKGVQNNAIADEGNKWPNGVIPYVIAASYNDNERATIAKAMGAYHQSTCIRFVPRSSDPDYIFIKKGSGCSSAVGRAGGEQTVSLGEGCIFYGIIVHELMHASGFWHEQSRADRDKYITIVWNNILPGMEYNFQKYDWNIIQNLGAPYDTESIMHYGKNAFAVDRAKPTIVANDGSEIGQRKMFSKVDMQKLNKLYQCNVVEGPSTSKPIVTTAPPASACEDSNTHCTFWAGSGECKTNPSWMNNNCKKSCDQCGKCQDDNANCDTWSTSGQCRKSPSYMHIHCKKSCGICSTSTAPSTGCKDDNKFCAEWSKSGECRVNPSYMLKSCRKSCGTC